MVKTVYVSFSSMFLITNKMIKFFRLSFIINILGKFGQS